MCLVWTARIGYGGSGIDITAKSASGLGAVLAPTWKLVGGAKHWKGYTPLTDEQYTEQYLELLRTRYRRDEKPFIELLNRKNITLLCYCPPKTFCHRYIAVDVLEKIAQAKGMEFGRGGEIYQMHIR